MNGKYTYKFVRIKLEGGKWTGRFDNEYQGAILEHSGQGWRFVQAFAPAVAGYGASRFVDLIFERTAE